MKIGITEAGDASLDYSWVNKINTIDGAILITKNITDKFIDEVLKVKDKIILHATCTGYGGTIIEPNIPDYKIQLEQVKKMIKLGFPAERIVIRIDPIIPTNDGIKKLKEVVEYIQLYVKRYRISIIDMYPHVRERFKKANVPELFNGNFQASFKEYNEVNKQLKELKKLYNVSFETCAEKFINEAFATGCVSEKDLNLLNLKQEENTLKGQRKSCLCLSCKTELLTHKDHKEGYGCSYKCLYCYWK